MSIRGTIGLQPALRDEQLDAPACLCQKCQGEVYRGEKLFKWHDRMVCADCFEFEVSTWLRVAPQEVAAALGVEMEGTD